MEYKFKQHKLSNGERIWLTELYKNSGNKIDVNVLKVKLWEKLPEDFDPQKFGYHFVDNYGLTLIGLWHIDPNNKLFNISDKVMRDIKVVIIENPNIDRVKATDLAQRIYEDLDDIEVALRLLYGLHLFFGSASSISSSSGYHEVGFLHDESKFDKILRYKSLEESMDEFYLKTKPKKELKSQVRVIKSKKENKNVWDIIENEYDVSKPSFGKKINFVKDRFKREIIFRDISQAFELAEAGFSKPSVILSGSIIEELLRLYLDHNQKTPNANTFDGYIKCCEEHELIKKGISRLSDSIRHFRNLVHLSREESKRFTISKATAKSAVASIFTIVNDF